MLGKPESTDARGASHDRWIRAELVADGLIAGPAEAPALVASRCRHCGVVAFPRQSSCAACTSGDVEDHRLARRGTLWTWTIQCFPPKSPPYAGAPEDFEPYGVGYVELPGELRVEALLTEADPARLRIGMPMELVLVPAPGGALTYAFRPVEAA
jgi:uncharacterized OB-fold protein